MDFLNIGPLELIVVFLVAFIVLGPERMVEMASSLGRFARQVRQGTAELTRDVLSREIERGGPLLPPTKDPAVASRSPEGTDSQNDRSPGSDPS